MSALFDPRRASLATLTLLALAAPGCAVDEPPAGQPASVSPAPDAQVESWEALDQMQRYVEDRVRPEHVRHAFRQPSGTWVDCVLVEQQPALRDTGERLLPTPASPSEEALSPEPSPERAGAEEEPDGDEAFLSGTVDQDGAARACPKGTIPVRRVQLADVARFRRLEHYFRKHGAAPAPAYGPTEEHQYAHAANWSVSNLGAASWMNVWAPAVAKAGEFSLSQLWVTRGSGATLQTLEAGWQVAPGYFGDSKAHLFIYSTSDGYTTNGGGCYNLDCNRFVQTSTSVVIGGALTPSVAGGKQYAIRLLYAYDAGTKAWWLWARKSTAATTDTAIGYYRPALFHATGLGGTSPRAATIDFGGEIIDDRTLHAGHTTTDMGAGTYPASGNGRAAYQRNAMVKGTDGTWKNASLTRAVDNRYCYDLAGPSSDPAGWGTYFYFGGPGYGTNCQ